MLSLHTSALGAIDTQHGVSPSEIRAVSDQLPNFLTKIHARDQGFYSSDILDNTALFEQIESYAESAENIFETIVLLGIGGSALGPIALRDAFGHSIGGTYPHLVVLDNIDPDLLAETLESLDLKETLFLVITKSGETPETISQYLFFSKIVREAGLLEKDHFLFITDPEKGFLREEANAKNISSFPVPANVGGRFSVLTSVGLVPGALIGLDIDELVRGAREMRDLFLSEDPQKNLPFQLAAIWYLLLQKGKSISVIYPYAHKLYRLGDWCRQLIGESTGKRFTESGKEVNTGITPIVSLGATDQHSQNQLYFEGPNDKFFLFLETKEFANTLEIPLPNPVPENMRYLSGTAFNELLHLEMEGTKGALTELHRPHVTIQFPAITEESVGAFFLLLEGATAFLGEFLNINVFNQPGVELSKKITKKLLLEQQAVN